MHQFLEEHYWTSHWSWHCENYWQFWTWNRNSISKQSKTDILCSDIQKKKSIRGRIAYPKCRTLSHQRGITLWTWKRRRKQTLLGVVEDQLRETCCGLCCKSFWNQETGFGFYQRFFQHSVLIHKKNHSYDGKEMENYSWQLIVRRRVSWNNNLQNGYKIGASLWSRRTTIR